LDKRVIALDSQRKFQAREFAAANQLGMKSEAEKYRKQFINTNEKFKKQQTM
jgi:hypothetical protein